MRARRLLALTLCVLVAAPLVLGAQRATPASAGNWVQFRGAAAGVAADDARLPEKWSDTDGLFAFDFNGEPAWSNPIGPYKDSAARRGSQNASATRNSMRSSPPCRRSTLL